MRYHVIEQWNTVASKYPRGRQAAWEVTTRRQEPGIYPMQGFGAFYYHESPIDLTVLTEDERVWFTDEPRQLYALAEIGLFRAHGVVLVGGLGLGLIHSFLRTNSNVTHVITCERAPELESLVWPYVKVGELRLGDFYEIVPTLAQIGVPIQTIITDFIFGHQNDKTWRELLAQRAFCKKHFPDALFLEHGYQERMDAELVKKAIPLDGIPYDVVRVVR